MLYYLGQAIKIPIKVNSTVSRYLKMVYTSPSGEIYEISGQPWEAQGAIVNNTVYTFDFTAVESGVYTYYITAYNNSTDLIEDEAVFCNCSDRLGSFNVIPNPLNECISNYAENPCSLSYYIKLLYGFMYLYENLGGGSCQYPITAPIGTVVQIMEHDTQKPVASAIVGNTKKQIFNLDEGLYTICVRLPNGKVETRVEYVSCNVNTCL